MSTMYKVISIDQNGCFTETIMYRSHVENDCWNFIRQRLTHFSAAIRSHASKLMVKNGMDEFVQPPLEVNILRKAA